MEEDLFNWNIIKDISVLKVNYINLDENNFKTLQNANIKQIDFFAENKVPNSYKRHMDFFQNKIISVSCDDSLFSDWTEFGKIVFGNSGMLESKRITFENKSGIMEINIRDHNEIESVINNKQALLKQILEVKENPFECFELELNTNNFRKIDVFVEIEGFERKLIKLVKDSVVSVEATIICYTDLEILLHTYQKCLKFILKFELGEEELFLETVSIPEHIPFTLIFKNAVTINVLENIFKKFQFTKFVTEFEILMDVIPESFLVNLLRFNKDNIDNLLIDGSIVYDYSETEMTVDCPELTGFYVHSKTELIPFIQTRINSYRCLRFLTLNDPVTEESLNFLKSLLHKDYFQNIELNLDANTAFFALRELFSIITFPKRKFYLKISFIDSNSNDIERELKRYLMEIHNYRYKEDCHYEAFEVSFIDDHTRKYTINKDEISFEFDIYENIIMNKIITKKKVQQSSSSHIAFIKRIKDHLKKNIYY